MASITPNTESALLDKKTKCLQFSNTIGMLRLITQTRTFCLTLRALPLYNKVIPALWLLVARNGIRR